MHTRTVVADSGFTVSEWSGLWREYNNTATATHRYEPCSLPPAAIAALLDRRPIFHERT